MLKINDIPDDYYNKECAIKGHSSQFWNKNKEEFLYKGKTIKYLNCPIDTTFQLLSTKNIPKKFPHSNCIRVCQPYEAKHLDWYITPNNITACNIYSYFTNTKISHWNNNKWLEVKKYYNTNINHISKHFDIKYKFIYYYELVLS